MGRRAGSPPDSRVGAEYQAVIWLHAQNYTVGIVAHKTDPKRMRIMAIWKECLLAFGAPAIEIAEQRERPKFHWETTRDHVQREMTKALIAETVTTMFAIKDPFVIAEEDDEDGIQDDDARWLTFPPNF